MQPTIANVRGFGRDADVLYDAAVDCDCPHKAARLRRAADKARGIAFSVSGSLTGKRKRRA